MAAQVVPLGDRGPRILPYPLDHRHGQLYYLAAQGAVVRPEDRYDGGRRRCLVVARRDPAGGAGNLYLTDAEIATAQTWVSLDAAGDACGWAMVWVVRVWQYWAGGPPYWLARPLAGSLRTPDTITVGVDPGAVRALALTVDAIDPDRVRRLLDQLIAAGFLTHLAAGDAGSWGVHDLTIPGFDSAGASR